MQVAQDNRDQLKAFPMQAINNTLQTGSKCVVDGWRGWEENETESGVFV